MIEGRGRGLARGVDRERLIGIGVVVVTAIPFLVAAWRGVDGGYASAGDDAILLIRARDVLTEHHPLLGTWTSASLFTGIHLNNLGPLYWDVLALPTKLWGDDGMVVGVVAMHLAFVLVAAAAARRAGGLVGLVVMMAVVSAVAWTMGNELLVDPFQPDGLLFAFIAFLAAVWALALGHWRWLVGVVVVGSLLLQTHVSYVLFVPGLAVLALVVAGLDLRRADPSERDAAEATSSPRREARRALVVSAVVGVVLWAQTFYEQVTTSPGNMGQFVLSARVERPRSGADVATRLVADLVAAPPWWGRPSYASEVPGSVFGKPALSLLTALLALGAVAVVIGACAWLARRARDRSALTLLGLAVVTLVMGVVTTATIPTTGLGLTTYHVRWLWCLSAFWMGAVLFALARRAEPVWGSARVALALAVPVVVLAALNLPAYDEPGRPFAEPWRVEELGRQLDGLEVDGPVRVDGVNALNPMEFATLAKLQEHGIEFLFRGGYMVHHLGDGRRDEGQARQRLFFRSGPEAFEVPAGAKRVVLVPGISDSQRLDMERLAADVAGKVSAHGMELTARGTAHREDLERDGIDVARVLDDPAYAARELEAGRLAGGIGFDMLAVDGVSPAVLHRLARLQGRAVGGFAVYVAPLRR